MTRARRARKAPNIGPWLTAGHVSRLLGVDLKTVHNWVNAGRIVARRTDGRHLRLRRVDVVRFLRAQGDEVPDGVGRLPTRLLLQAGSAPRRTLGLSVEESASLVTLAFEAASGPYEFIVLDLDAQPPSFVDDLVRSLRSRPGTAGAMLVGVSRASARRSRFLRGGGDVAVPAGSGRAVALAVAWLTGRVAEPPRGATVAAE